MAKSTLRRPRRKAAKSKGDKPHPDFPLFKHQSGRWCKKVRGKFRYFGKIADDPDGQAALELWLAQKDDLLAGRTPRTATDEVTLGEVVNRFLTAKQDRCDEGALTHRSWLDYKATCDVLIEQFGKRRIVVDLAADDFARLRNVFSKTRGPVALGNQIQRVRSVFKYAYENGLIDHPVRFGSEFKKPAARVMRRQRRQNGKRMFEADEIRALLTVAPVQLRAMILLGVNCGFGNTDCGTLPQHALDLEGGWIDYSRTKTGIDRRCPLWPETVGALREAIAERAKPAKGTDPELVFITSQGNRWAKDKAESPISQSLARILRRPRCGKCGTINSSKAEKCKCGWKPAKGKEWPTLYRRGVNFYALRHTFETIGGESKDQVAVDAIMGHVDGSMAGHYRERISDDRLRAVAGHVRDWLFGSVKAKG